MGALFIDPLSFRPSYGLPPKHILERETISAKI
jgi:hypothetical protein